MCQLTVNVSDLYTFLSNVVVDVHTILELYCQLVSRDITSENANDIEKVENI